MPRPRQAGLIRALARVLKTIGNGVVLYLPEILAAVFAFLALHSAVPAYAVLNTGVVGGEKKKKKRKTKEGGGGNGREQQQQRQQHSRAELRHYISPRKMRVLYVMGKKVAKESLCSNRGYVASEIFWRGGQIDSNQFRDSGIRTACLRCLCEIFDLYPEYDYGGWMDIFMIATSRAIKGLPASVIGHARKKSFSPSRCIL